ncbi:MGH1-like glycoside hydrolase domain-containing protein [Paenibacillus sp. SYP-B4298]|uniref:MGH1-like glycoside hydrolase domain-containing protein n=1 Tax=Paenibacillus sp. SYP-B4298 TaxID=2996034 RepID=UPI0022DDD0C6|nr:trehalase family glycosidase [Paenibacillus sp. SYP-B4298]
MEDLFEQKKRVKDFVLKAGKDMLHEPTAYIKHPFIVPGSVYAHHLWDWDCFFAVMALLQVIEVKQREGTLEMGERELYLKHAQGNVLNFIDAQLEDGYIPIMLFADSDADSRVLYRNGCPVNMHKPCLALNAVMISRFMQDFNWLESKYENFKRYYECYKSVYRSESGLFVWADDVMIGVDNDPSTFGRPPYSSANLYLNSFMVRELRSLAILSTEFGYNEDAAYYEAEAAALSDLIQEECWDTREEIYYSVDVNCKTHRANPRVSGYHMGLGVFWRTVPIKVQSWSSFLPMWAGIPNEKQVKSLVERHIRNEETFWSANGVRSLSKHEKMYTLVATGNPSNWLGPIWLVTQYVIFESLIRYGYRNEANELMEKAVNLLSNDIKTNQDLHEYYNPETGAGIINKGFFNWNLLALNMMNEIDGYPSPAALLP